MAHGRRRFVLIAALLVVATCAPGAVATAAPSRSSRSAVAASGPGHASAGTAHRSTGRGVTAHEPVISAEERHEREEEMMNEEPAPKTPTAPQTGTRHAPPAPLKVKQAALASSPVPKADGTPLFFRRNAISSGASLIAEPSVASNGTGVLETWNWYAGASLDGGAHFSFLNPYSVFPSVNGGFCCDQLAHYQTAQGIFIWVLQYNEDSSHNNTIRVAVANSAANAANGIFYYWDFTPQGIGSPNGTNYDQPKIASSNGNVFLTMARYGAASGSVVLRLPAATLANHGFLNYEYYFPGLFSPVFTDGAASTMYFAAHVDTDTLRVYTWPDANDVNHVSSTTVNHTKYPVNLPFTCPRTGGSATSDWCQRRSFGGGWAGDDRMKAGWVGRGMIGFAWGASQGAWGFTGSAPYPYTDIVLLSQSTLALVKEPIIWSNSYAFLYPAFARNLRGDVGGSVMYGGGSQYENCTALFNDDGFASGWATLGGAVSNSDPNDKISGDYLSAAGNGGNGYTWSATCYALQGSSSSSSAYYMSFGRDYDTPLRTLSVTTSGGGTVSSSPLGISCPFDCSEDYTVNTAVTLTPHPSAGYTFTGWSGSCSGTGGCTVPMSFARSVGASFADLTAPSLPTFTAPPKRFTLAKGFVVKWSASDAGTGVKNYDVRYRTAPRNAGFGSYTTLVSATTSTQRNFTGNPGSTYCFSARARDNAGNVSAYGPQKCTSIPVDDRAATAKGSWTRPANSSAFLNTLSVSSVSGSTLTLTGVQAQYLALLAQTCSTCGKVEVRWNGVLKVTINTATPTVQNKKLFAVANLGSVQNGTLQIKVITAGKPVRIDGFAVSRI
jgi:hypothetical protein